MRADKPNSAAVLGELRTGRPEITMTVEMPRLELLSGVNKFCFVLFFRKYYMSRQRVRGQRFSNYIFYFGPIIETLEGTLE